MRYAIRNALITAVAAGSFVAGAPAPLDKRDPVYAFVTVTEDPVYVTVGGGAVYSTDYANAVDYVTTVWPTEVAATTTEPAADAVTTAPAAAAAAPTTTSPVAAAEPSTTSTPAAAAESATTSTPAVAAEPTTTSTPAAAEPTTTSTPAAAEPTTTSTPAAAEPSTTSTPAAAGPTTTSTPAAAEPTTTSTPAAAEPTTTSTPAAEPTTTSSPAAATTTSSPAGVTTTSTPAVETSSSQQSPTSTTSSSSASPSATGNSALPSVIVYSPYNDDHSCKDYSTVYNDLSYILSKGISSIRMYATDCNSLETVQPAAQNLGFTIEQGFYITSAGVDSIDDSVSDLIDWAASNGGWSMYPKIIVGNEAIMNGWATGDELADKINSVRSQLRAAGYTGPVLTAEPVSSYQSYPVVCDAMDIVGVNAHSYFAASYYADQAGEFVLDQKSQAESLCGKTAYITETGYPSKGDVNGNNDPTPDNQMAAVYSILDTLNGDVTLLTTYNDMWKDPGPYGIEQYFGAAWFLE